MLSKLLELHSISENIKEAVDCLVQLRCPTRAVQFMLDQLRVQHFNEALQTAFNLFEEAPMCVVTDAIFQLKERLEELTDEDERSVGLLIADKVLNGQISASLYSDFVTKNYCLDKVALRKIMQQNSSSAEQLSAYSLMLSLMSLSTCYYEHRGNVVDKQKCYPRLAHFAQIALVYRGSSKTP